MPKLDFSQQATPASMLDFSGASDPVDDGLSLHVDPRAGSELPIQRIGLGGDVPVASVMPAADAAGEGLLGSLATSASVLPLAAGGANTLLGMPETRDSNFAAATTLRNLGDKLNADAASRSATGATAGNVAAILPKLLAAPLLASQIVSGGTQPALHALDKGADVATAEKLMGLGTSLNAAANLLPIGIGGNVLTRTLTGGAINAGAGYAIPAAEHAVAPAYTEAPTVQDAITQGGIGAIIAAALGRGPVPRVAGEPRMEADPVPMGLPRGADFSAKAEPVRPAPVDLGGAVHVDPAGTAATPAQGANAFAQAVASRMQPAAPSLPEPVVAVDRTGNAATSADQNAAMQPVAPTPADPLGLTERLRQLIAADPRTAREGAHVGPLALPAPTIAVDAQGNAATTSQLQQAIARQQQAAAERQALGITPDIERSQGVRWSKQQQASAVEAERQARLAELDQSIATREAQNVMARGANARPDETVDDALTFLAKKGGLDRRTFIKEGLDPAAAKAMENRTRGGASRPLFRAQDKGGMSLDHAAEALWQHGYLPEQDNNAALDMILSGVNQDTKAYSIHRQDQGDLLAMQQARNDAANRPADDFADVPFSRKPEGQQGSIETVYRGVGGDNGGGNYFTPDKEFARNFTRSGQDSEIQRRGIRTSDIYETAELPSANDEAAVDAAIREERAAGKKAIRVSEGEGQPSSVFVFDKTGIIKAPKFSFSGERPRESVHANNASGESAASLEAINRQRDEQAQGRTRALIDRYGNVEPLVGADAVDAKAREGQVIVQRGIGREPWTVLDHGGDISPTVAQGKVNRARGELDALAERAAPAPAEAAAFKPRAPQPVRSVAPGRDALPEPRSADAQDTQAIATYNAKLSDYIGKPVDLSPAAHVPDATAHALAAFDGAFGGRTIVIHNASPDALDFNGVTLRDGVRLVNEDATSPLLTVAGHEMIHQLRQDAPDLYDELAAEVKRQGRLDAYGKDLNAKARASGENRDVHPELVAEELAADAAGDALTDPAFIEQLAKDNPSLFQKLAQRMRDFLATVSSKLRGLGSSKYLDDVAAFRSKLADVLERYAERQQAKREPRAASEETSLSRKPAVDQTETPEFKKWFGDSKVVDAEGKPLVVYHGTEADVKAFDPSKAKSEGNAFFFSNSWPLARKSLNAETYAGSRGSVMPVFLSIHNPHVIGIPHNGGKHNITEQSTADEIDRFLDDVENFNRGLDYTKNSWLSRQIEIAKRSGNDGVIVYGLEDDRADYGFNNTVPTTVYIAFRPEQIKSATGNRGTFDASNPDIRFSRKPTDDADYLQDMPSRRPGESQAAYLRRITRKNGADIKAATAMVNQQRQLGRHALRGMMATLARQAAIADAAMRQARRTFDETPDVINFTSVHQWETGQHIDDPDFRNFVATMQDGFDQRIAAIQKLAPGALESLIENYMPHLYEDSGKATKWYQNVMGKKPLQGDRSFLKQREWPTLKEAMASGLKPISPNPADWVLMKYHQMDKFIGLLTLKDDFARRGWLMKLEAGQRVPEGFARVDDPAFQISGGMQGYYAVPEMIAKDINNYLAPGLSRYGAWRSMRAVQNAMVSWNLGWSAFHAGFTSIDNAVTHGAAGLQMLVDGDLIGGLTTLAKSVPTMLTSPFEGGRLNKQWTGQKATDVHTAALLDLLEQGGARMKMNNVTAEYNNALPQVLRTLRRMKASGYAADQLAALQRRLSAEPAAELARMGWGSLKGVGKAISAIGEVGSFLIHHVLVPNQKMASRVTLMKFELDHYAKQLGKQRGDYAGIISVMHPDVARQLASDVVDKVDFRLGQMTYENFFYPKIAREIAQMLVMAPGWQAGAYQTMTGGIRDVARLVKPEKLVNTLDKAGTITDAHRGRFTNNLANLIMLFLMVGGGNALWQYLVSGKEPDEMKDIVAPRTGRKNADDSDERIVLPSYMKDHYEFFNHPLQMASHKLHPAWRLMWEVGHNEDYFGNMIRDPHHPLGAQAKELAGYLLKSMLPFSATNVAKVRENGGGFGQHVANFVGVTPASASLARSKFQAFVAKGGERGWDGPAQTPTQAEYNNRMRKAENAMRTGQQPDLTGLNQQDVTKLQRRVRTFKPEMQFDRLSLADKLDAYELATPDERTRYHLTEVLSRTNPSRSIAFRRLPEEEQQALLKQLTRIRQGKDK